MANIRAAYAEVVVADLTGEAEANKTQTVNLVSDTTNWKSDATAKIGNTTYEELIGSDQAKATSIIVSCKDGVVTVGSKTVQQ